MPNTNAGGVYPWNHRPYAVGGWVAWTARVAPQRVRRACARSSADGINLSITVRRHPLHSRSDTRRGCIVARAGGCVREERSECRHDVRDGASGAKMKARASARRRTPTAPKQATMPARRLTTTVATQNLATGRVKDRQRPARQGTSSIQRATPRGRKSSRPRRFVCSNGADDAPAPCPSTTLPT